MDHDTRLYTHENFGDTIGENMLKNKNVGQVK